MSLPGIARILTAFALGALSSTEAQSAPSGGQQATGAVRAGVVATELINRPIEDSRAAFAGVVREIVLDPSRGSVRLVVVELGATPDRPIAVPWTYLDIRQDGSIGWRATAEQIRRAPAYVSDTASATDEPEEPNVAYAPSEDPVDRFDPSRVATYRGVIAGTTTGFFQGELVAIVVIADAQKIRARLGPEIYLTQIGLGLTPGQSVVIQGFSLAGDDPPLVVVSELTVQDKKFVLRNMDGTPLWSRANVPNRLN